MAVYVDNARIPARVNRINGRWSHLTADTVEELNEFALDLGLSLQWFQTCKRPCHSRLPCVHWHYDVVDFMRERAIRAGAKPIDVREMGALTRARRQALLAEDAE